MKLCDLMVRTVQRPQKVLKTLASLAKTSAVAQRFSRKRWTGITAVVIVAVACLFILRPFISAALWAAILCFSTWPLFTRLTTELGDRRTLAALLTTLLLSAIIIVPVAILVSRITAHTAEIVEASRKLIHEGPPAAPAWVASVPIVGPRLATRWSVLANDSAERLAAIIKWLPMVKEVVLGSARALAASLVQILLSLLMVFLFYCDGEAAANRLKSPSIALPAQKESSARRRGDDDTPSSIWRSGYSAPPGRAGWRRLRGRRSAERGAASVSHFRRSRVSRGAAGCGGVSGFLALPSRGHRMGDLHRKLDAYRG
jgi:hypothetical protein